MGAQPILTGGKVSSQGIFQESTTQLHPVGTRAQLPDGRVYYYARNASTALSPGNLAMSEKITAEFANQAIAAAAAIGTDSVSATLGATAVTVDEYAEGYLVINDEAGEGHSYKIKSHALAIGAAAVTINLYDTIQVALTTSSEYTLVKNLWADVVVAIAGEVNVACGVAPIGISLGSSTPYYFWMQTWGVCAGWDDTNTAIGAALQSGATEGQIDIVGTTSVGFSIGTQLFTGVNGEYYPKFLTIAP